MDIKYACSVLGIEETATLEEIKKKFRELAHQYHPDKPMNPQDSNHFTQITECYNFLIKQKSKQIPTQELKPKPRSNVVNSMAQVFGKKNIIKKTQEKKFREKEQKEQKKETFRYYISGKSKETSLEETISHMKKYANENYLQNQDIIQRTTYVDKLDEIFENHLTSQSLEQIIETGKKQKDEQKFKTTLFYLSELYQFEKPPIEEIINLTTEIQNLGELEKIIDAATFTFTILNRAEFKPNEHGKKYYNLFKKIMASVLSSKKTNQYLEVLFTEIITSAKRYTTPNFKKGIDYSGEIVKETAKLLIEILSKYDIDYGKKILDKSYNCLGHMWNPSTKNWAQKFSQLYNLQKKLKKEHNYSKNEFLSLIDIIGTIQKKSGRTRIDLQFPTFINLLESFAKVIPKKNLEDANEFVKYILQGSKRYQNGNNPGPEKEWISAFEKGLITYLENPNKFEEAVETIETLKYNHLGKEEYEGPINISPQIVVYWTNKMIENEMTLPEINNLMFTLDRYRIYRKKNLKAFLHVEFSKKENAIFAYLKNIETRKALKKKVIEKDIDRLMHII